ncbi:MAG TPA: type I glyceraldehyde-3-phosphate dehydrogenase [Patescibacteria group bacterium]
MKKLRIGLNGFGRIGRIFTRQALTKNSFDIVQINTRKKQPAMLAYLLQYDSVYGPFQSAVIPGHDQIIAGNQTIKTTAFDDLNKTDWDNIDILVDATGVFLRREDFSAPLANGVKKIIITAPAKDDTIDHCVLGVNDDQINFKKTEIIANCSCTTTAVAPIFKLINDNFKIISGYLTATHSYTTTQNLLDNSHSDFTRSRAAGINIIPTTTGAAKAVEKVLPELKGRLSGLALRVPLPTVSVADLSIVVEKQTNIEQVNQIIREAAQNSLAGILQFETQPLVSSDYIGSPYSGVVDGNYTEVMNGNLIKIFCWYDNEWGYCSRLIDLVEKFNQIL